MPPDPQTDADPTHQCQECGRTWTYTGTGRPQCTRRGCRSTNVTPIDEDPPVNPSPDPDDGDDDPELDVDHPEIDAIPDFNVTGGDADVDELPDGDDLDLTTPDEAGDDQDLDEPAPEALEMQPEDVAPVWGAVFDVVAARKGDHWALDDAEAQHLGRATARLTNKHVPRAAAYSAELYAVVALCLVLSPRLREDRDDTDGSDLEDVDENVPEIPERGPPDTDDPSGYAAKIP